MFYTGEVLDKIQRSGVFPDCKTFVDMSLKVDYDVMLTEFRKLPEPCDKQTINIFLENYFNPAGFDVESVIPEDFTEHPKFIQEIQNEELREWADKLNKTWKKLAKRVSLMVLEHPERHSLVYVPHNFIVPGGRFREMFYWDSLWTMKGLLLCGMTKTVEGMLRNLLSLVNEFGFVPNFIRRYSLDRSQAPLLASMVELYVNHTDDVHFVSEALPTLEKEYTFWMEQRTVTVTHSDGTSYKLQRYCSKLNLPRAEAYREDLETFTKDSEEPRYDELRAACESGWDFSSRWFNRSPTLSSIRTSQIIPVDLNSMVYMMEASMANLYKIQGNASRQQYFIQQCQERVTAIEKIFWDETHRSWFDFYLADESLATKFTSASAFPIFADCHGNTPCEKAKKERAYISYLQHSGVLNYPGGVPATSKSTNQQWDFPNAWPPLVHALVTGLYRSSQPDVREVGIKLAKQWIRSNYLTWKETGHMFEKYNVERVSGAGGNGEYEVQVGFGWTNGVVLDFISLFGEELGDVTKL